jgi:hypothetical protein
MSSKAVLTSREPKTKEEVKSCRADTKRGAYVKQLFSKEGVSAKTSVLGTNAKGTGKLWPGVADTLGYGFKAEVVGGTKNEKTGAVEGGEITHFGVLPKGLEAPVFATKPEKKAKEKGESGAKPAPKAKPAAPVAKPAAPVEKPKTEGAAA